MSNESRVYFNKIMFLRLFLDEFCVKCQKNNENINKLSKIYSKISKKTEFNRKIAIFLLQFPKTIKT